MSSVNYAHELSVDTPIQWLWDELEAHLPAEVFAKFKNGYMKQQRHYARCSRLNSQVRWVEDMAVRGRGDDLDVMKWRAILSAPAAYVFSEEIEK